MGTMICAVLIDQFDEFEDASTTLTYFGERRTDLNVANQFQGVETFSQIRYVSYFTEMHKKKMRVVPARPKKDVKFMFTCSTKGVPVGYDNCAFFFWLNTFFIKDNRELMKRDQLDNPHKEKTWRVWRENLSVEVVFQDPK